MQQQRDPFVALMRRYVIDYTNRHDTNVCSSLMEDDYTLQMGPHILSGRDTDYIPAAQKQFTQFPGLCLTVHEIITNGDRLAMRFSEHGLSARHDGAGAAWQGIGLYQWNGDKLIENKVEQDYYSRRRQFIEQVPDSVGTPALAPWDTVAQASDPEAESVVRQWIAGEGYPGHVRFDDGDTDPLLSDFTDSVDDLFSAGQAVAFRVTREGVYTGGLSGVDESARGGVATMHMVGVVHVAGGQISGGQVIRDRLGLARSLARTGV